MQNSACMMENTKLVLVFCILMSSSCVTTLCVSSTLDLDVGDYFSAMAGGSFTCMEKLMPCKPYLVPGPNPPPANCCTPLTDLLVNDTKCICDTFNNDLVRGSLNVSMEDIMKLPKACNQTFDLAVCNSTSPPAKDSKHSGGKSSSASLNSMDSDSPPDNDNDNDNDSTKDNDSPSDSDSKSSGANGKLSSSLGRGYIFSLAFFVAVVLSVY